MNKPRVLVAEDEFIVAMDLCDTIAEAGCEIEGPHADLSSAMLAVQKNRPDIAILDVNLRDGESFALAEKLMAENVPVIFHSGHFTVAEMQDRFPEATACTKPCPPGQMIERVQEALAA
uniref:response regulator n=1 Tax=Parerythrobacter lutipelagi TaxID=1964208 RepID=UPI001F01E728|nr:response regulator [Parerythrobacter lutipelagi]